MLRKPKSLYFCKESCDDIQMRLFRVKLFLKRDDIKAFHSVHFRHFIGGILGNTFFVAFIKVLTVIHILIAFVVLILTLKELNVVSMKNVLDHDFFFGLENLALVISKKQNVIKLLVINQLMADCKNL